jgi:hypothetical protein
LKSHVVPKLELVGAITITLAKLAAALDGSDPVAHLNAVREARTSLAKYLDDDEAFALIRLVKEARIVCRICERCKAYARTDRGLCLECARQVQAEAEPQ